MEKYDIENLLRELEVQMELIKNRLSILEKMQKQLTEVDERTKQFKPFTQIGHPDE
jgi:predicted transcriptional regulator